MAYGQGEYGQRGFGGSSFEEGGPQLVSSNPINGAINVLPTATISFVVGSGAGLDINTLSVGLGGAQAVVGGTLVSGYGGSTIEFLDDERYLEITLSTHPFLAAGATQIDIEVTDLAGEVGALSFSFNVATLDSLDETVTVTESLADTTNHVLSETVVVSDAVGGSAGISSSASEQVNLTEKITTGSFQVESIDGTHIQITLDQELHFDFTKDLRHYLAIPSLTNPGVPISILDAELIYTTYQTGSSGRFVPDIVGSGYDLDGDTLIFEFHGDIESPANLGDFIEILNGPNGGRYQIEEILATDIDGDVLSRVRLNRLATLSNTLNGSLNLAETIGITPRIDLVSIRNEGADPDVGGTPDYVYTFQVTDPRVTSENPILEVYRVEKLARSGISGLDADSDAVNPPGKVVPTYSEFLDPEETTVPEHTFDVTTDLTILDYQTFEVRDPSLVTNGILLRATSGRPPIGGIPTAVSGSYESFTGIVQVAGNVEWVHTSGVTGVVLETTKMTGLANYLVQIQGLFLKIPKLPYTSDVVDMLATSIPKPRLSAASVRDNGVVDLVFNEFMQQDDDNLNNPLDYSIVGPTTVVVQRVYSLGQKKVSLITQGLSDGDYTLTISAATPKDIAGNPLDPAFNTAVFTASTPLNARSIFTDKGPIARPPLTLQSGTLSTLETFDEVTLTGAALTLTDIGQQLRLTGSALNDGDYRILSIISSERVRVKASFSLPDANNGSIDWAIIDPRYGQIADDPSDVTVRLNGSPITPVAVVGLQGQIVLDASPAPADDVQVDYTWCRNPKVEIRRLNSKEFRLNAWNRDLGGVSDTHHHYRYNNVLITPSDYDSDDMKAALPSPILRKLKYRAYERAYTAVLNDPSLLVLNNPSHKIAFPPASRPLSEVAIFYEGVVLPENDVNPWVRKGTGTATASAGILTLIDDSTGTFPTGNPVFWTKTLDLTFDHVFSAAWRFSLNSTPTLEGIWTGVAAGYSDEKQVFVVGYLNDGGVKKIGFLKRGVQDNIEAISSWTGGLDSSDAATGAPVAFDWSILHSYRLFRDQDGVVKLFLDGDVVETLRLTPNEAPFLKEVNAPFNEIQGAFFGSLSRPAENSSSWDFYRYLIQPINSQQVSSSSFVSYEANGVPELDPAPWTPVGFHGASTVLSADFLILDSTSASDASNVGLVGGDFHGYVKLEPLLSSASQFSVDFKVQLLTYTHGIDPNGLMVAVDDSNRLIQLCFLQDVETPKLSYGGRSFPEDFSPYAWSVIGTQVAEMVGRYLRITDASNADGLVYFIEDSAPASSSSRVLGAAHDYLLESRMRVDSFTADGSGFAGVFAQAFDGVRSVGFYLEETSGVRYVTLHSDGVPVGASFAFEWDDGEFHTYRMRKSTTGDLVSVFVDSTFLGSLAYSSFSTPTPDASGLLSFGSSTAASAQAQSTVTWAYCNAWRVNTDTNPITAPKKYLGLWKGYSSDSLIGYHLPLKSKGNATVSGNTLMDPLADFVTDLVAQGDRLIVDVGSNQGIYYVDNVVNATTLTLTTAWPVQPSGVDYRIAAETDWSVLHKYRLVKDPSGGVAVFLDANTEPLLLITYNSLDLPVSSTGVVKTLSSGLAAIAFGSFSSENLEQSQWDFVRYGITRYSGGRQIVPPHQILNQWNVMESPERLYTVIPHDRTDFKSSSTGITSQEVVDFLAREDVDAYTQLNEDTPLVPVTQSFETRGPYATQQFLSVLNSPADVLNDAGGGFVLNDGTFRYTLIVPNDVLYSCIKVIETSTGDVSLIKPFDDESSPRFGSLQYQLEVCLDYTADTLPEEDPTAWVLNSANPAEVSASVFGGILTYGTGGTGTRTVYLNNTPLPDAPSLQTEVTFRLRLASDSTGGTGDSQVRFGLSAPGMTVGLGFVTTVLGDRFLLVYDINSGGLLGHATFDYLDGNYHTYRIVRTPGKGKVEIFIDT